MKDVERFPENGVTTFKVMLAGVAAFWFGLNPLVQLLLAAMILDIITGVLSAYVRKTVSSAASFRGMAKKSIILLLVWGAWLAGGQIAQPLGEAVAGFYILNEMTSIIENAAESGLPVPKFLVEALEKISAEKPEPPANARGAT